MNSSSVDPRFDLPISTTSATQVLTDLDVRLPQMPPIPGLIEPEDAPPVLGPSLEALVVVAHRRIRTLSNYWHAGWQCARPDTLLRSGTFDRLAAVAEALPDRFGLAVFDGWRPLALQAELFAAAYSNPQLPAGFVAPPESDPTIPPPHLTGGTVDLTLTLDGIALAPDGGFDDFTDRAHADALEKQTGPNRDVRRMLYWAMRAQGFVVLQQEWWHFEYGTRRWAGITGAAPFYGPGSIQG